MAKYLRILFYGCHMLKNQIKILQSCLGFNWIVLQSYAKGDIH